ASTVNMMFTPFEGVEMTGLQTPPCGGERGDERLLRVRSVGTGLCLHVHRDLDNHHSRHDRRLPFSRQVFQDSQTLLADRQVEVEELVDPRPRLALFVVPAHCREHATKVPDMPRFRLQLPDATFNHSKRVPDCRLAPLAESIPGPPSSSVIVHTFSMLSRT